MSDLEEQNARAQKQALINFQAKLNAMETRLENQDLQIAQLRETVTMLDNERTKRIVDGFSGGSTA